MPKYQVNVSIMGQYYIEAESAEEAEDVAHGILAKWECPDDSDLTDTDFEVIAEPAE